MRVSTLHVYERKGLIFATRTAGNQRRCASDVLCRIAFIRTAHGVGVPLATAAAPARRCPVSEIRQMGGFR